jgi:hypothetical protein
MAVLSELFYRIDLKFVDPDRCVGTLIVNKYIADGNLSRSFEYSRLLVPLAIARRSGCERAE